MKERRHATPHQLALSFGGGKQALQRVLSNLKEYEQGKGASKVEASS